MQDLLQLWRGEFIIPRRTDRFAAHDRLFCIGCVSAAISPGGAGYRSRLYDANLDHTRCAHLFVRSGISRKGVEDLLDWEQYPELNEKDRLVVKYSVAVTANRHRIRDAMLQCRDQRGIDDSALDPIAETHNAHANAEALA